MWHIYSHSRNFPIKLQQWWGTRIPHVRRSSHWTEYLRYLHNLPLATSCPPWPLGPSCTHDYRRSARGDRPVGTSSRRRLWGSPSGDQRTTWLPELTSSLRWLVTYQWRSADTFNNSWGWISWLPTFVFRSNETNLFWLDLEPYGGPNP